jgi:hypothetical protein
VGVGAGGGGPGPRAGQLAANVLIRRLCFSGVGGVRRGRGPNVCALSASQRTKQFEGASAATKRLLGAHGSNARPRIGPSFRCALNSARQIDRAPYYRRPSGARTALPLFFDAASALTCPHHHFPADRGELNQLLPHTALGEIGQCMLRRSMVAWRQSRSLGTSAHRMGAHAVAKVAAAAEITVKHTSAGSVPTQAPRSPLASAWGTAVVPMSEEWGVRWSGGAGEGGRGLGAAALSRNALAVRVLWSAVRVVSCAPHAV